MKQNWSSTSIAKVGKLKTYSSDIANPNKPDQPFNVRSVSVYMQSGGVYYFPVNVYWTHPHNDQR